MINGSREEAAKTRSVSSPSASQQTTSLPESGKPLSKLEIEWKERIHGRLLEVMDLSLIGTLDDDQARDQIRELSQRLLVEEAAPLNVEQRKRVVQRVEDEVLGLGPLEPLLHDSTVSDILVNGAHQVYVERKGKLQLTDVNFSDDRHLLNIIDRIVSSIGRRIDESSPMVDARLSDGSRVNVIIPPLALDGPTMSIRRFAVELLSIDDLITLGSVSAELAQVLKAVLPAQCLGVRRHRRRQDHAIEYLVRVHPDRRAHCHHRGLCGAAAAAATCRSIGDASSQYRGQG